MVSEDEGFALVRLDPQTILWVWYGFMLAVSGFNLLWLRDRWTKLRPRDSYGKVMLWLGVPWVVECAWRSVFPSLYLQRYVFWNTWLNSIIVDRTLACIGELCWCTQFALALSFLDQSISKKKTWWIQFSSILAVLVYVAAECTSYYNVATTNELWCAIEVILDAISFVCMFPGYAYLWARSPGSLRTSSAKRFLAITTILCVLYPVYNFAVDAPMYIERYRVDQENHKEYFSFWSGIKDAATRRVPTHNFEDWCEDMTWMTLYFSFGAWSGLLLMNPPRLQEENDDDPKAPSGAYVSLAIVPGPSNEATHA